METNPGRAFEEAVRVIVHKVRISMFERGTTSLETRSASTTT